MSDVVENNHEGRKHSLNEVPLIDDGQGSKADGNPDSGINEDGSDYGGGKKMSTSRVPLPGGCSPERKRARFDSNYCSKSHFTAQDFDTASNSIVNNGALFPSSY